MPANNGSMSSEVLTLKNAGLALRYADEMRPRLRSGMSTKRAHEEVTALDEFAVALGRHGAPLTGDDLVDGEGDDPGMSDGDFAGLVREIQSKLSPQTRPMGSSNTSANANNVQLEPADKDAFANKPQQTIGAAVMWAMSHMRMDGVTTSDAPSALAWSLLSLGRESQQGRTELMRMAQKLIQKLDVDSTQREADQLSKEEMLDEVFRIWSRVPPVRDEQVTPYGLEAEPSIQA